MQDSEKGKGEVSIKRGSLGKKDITIPGDVERTLIDEVKEHLENGTCFSIALIEIESEEEVERVLNIIKQNVRKSDLILSIDPNSYLLVLKETNPDIAERVFFRIKSKLETLSSVIKFGNSNFPSDGTEFEELLAHALSNMEKINISKVQREGISIFVNREREIAVIDEAISKLRDGEGGFLILKGKLGSGKTSLLNRSKERLKGFTVINGKVSIFEKLNTYTFLQFFQDNEDIKKQDPGLMEEMDEGSFSMNRVDLIERFLNSLSKSAKERAIVFLIDDFNYLDTQSFKLISLVVKELSSLPALWIVTSLLGFREDEVEEFILSIKRHIKINSLVLKPLSKEDVLKIAEHYFPNEKIPDNFVEYLMKETGGIPFFVHGILEGYREKGISQTLDIPLISGQFEFDKPHLRYLKQKLYALDSDTKFYLEAASIAGRIFEDSTVRLLLRDAETKDYDRVLDGLIKMELLERVNNEEIFAFSPPILRECITKVMGARKKTLSREMVNILEKRGVGAKEEELFSLAEHAKNAGLYEKAVVYYKKAGESVQNKSKKKAYIYFGKAIELIDKAQIKDDSFLWDLHMKRGESALFIDPEGAKESGEKALKMAPDRAKRAEALCLIGEACAQLGDKNRALLSLREAQKEFEVLRDLSGLIRSYRALGNLHLCWGQNIGAAEKYFFKAIALITEGLTLDNQSLEVERELSRLYSSLGGYYYSAKGNLRRAKFYFEKALSISQKLEEEEEKALSLHNIGVLKMKEGDLKGSEELLKGARNLQETHGLLKPLAISLDSLGYISRVKGEYEASINYHRDAVKAVEKIGKFPFSKARSLLLMSISFARMGKFNSAIKLLDEADVYLSEDVPPYLKVISAFANAEVYIELDILDRLDERLDEAIEIIDENTYAYLKPEALRLKGELMLNKGNKDALSLIDEARSLSMENDRIVYWYSTVSYLKGLSLGNEEDVVDIAEELIGETGAQGAHDISITAHRVFGEYFWRNLKVERAEEEFLKAFTLAEKLKYKKEIFESAMGLYRVYGHMKREKEAKEFLMKAESVLEDMKKEFPGIMIGMD
jgi:tetratricopeptide (TPR) repeat protein